MADEFRFGGIDLTDAVVAAPFERTIEGASIQTLTVNDPERELLAQVEYDEATGRIKETTPLRIGDEEYLLVKVSKNGESFDWVFEDLAVASMRKANARRRARRGDVTRAQFVRSLVESVRPRIPFFAPELNAPQEQARPSRDEREEIREAQKNPGLDRGARITVKGQRATDRQLRTIELAMSTADEVRAARRETKAMLLAGIAEGQFVPDRLNFSGSGALGPWQILRSTAAALGIPYDGSDTAIVKGARAFLVGLNGSGFRGPGYDARSLAKANPTWSAGRIAQEVEGAGVGNFYSEWEAEAERILEAWGGGALKSERGGTVTYEKDYFFTVGPGGRDGGPKGENYWEASGRLAEQVGRQRFIVDGEFWWISEEDLFARPVQLALSEDDEGVESIDFDMDNGKKVKEATVQCRADGLEAGPGGLVRISDPGPQRGKWLISTIEGDRFSKDVTVTLRKPIKERPEPRGELVTRTVSPDTVDATPVKAGDGARGIVEQAVEIAKAHGGEGVYVGSAFRPGSTTTSGNLSDHAGNDATRAARDIGVQGINLLTGPPSPKLDKAVAAIGEAFGRSYGDGKRTIIDTFTWEGYRVQIIWRTPAYGGHMGHIHIGARKL